MIFDPYEEWLGIPPEHQPPSHYLLLGLEPGESDPQQIRAAADSLLRSIRELRDDEHEEAARKIFTHVKEARACLLDEKQKRSYDLKLFGSVPPIPFDEPAELTEVATPRPRKSRPGIGLLLGFLMGPITVAAVYFLVIKQDEPPQIDNSIPTETVTHIEPPVRQTPELPGGENRGTKTDRGNTGNRETDEATTPTERVNPAKVENSTQFGTLSDEPNVPENSTTAGISDTKPVQVPRVPRPSEDDLETARKTILALYDSRISNAKDRAAKKALAREMIGVNKTGSQSDAEAYALLELAIRVATEAGAIDLTDEAILLLTARFDVSDLPYRATAVKDWAAIISKEFRAEEKSARQALLAIIATSLAEEAGRRNANDIAVELFKLASSQTEYAGDKDRARELFRRAQNFERLARERTAAQPQIDAALAAPEDPGKNDIAADLLCFQLNDWEAGMPFLSRGSNEELKQLALRDLQNSEAVPTRLQLADDWWAAAENSARSQKPALQKRSVGIYESVYENLQGLDFAKATSRMRETGPVTITLPSPRIHFDFEPRSIQPNGRTAILQNRMGKIASGELVGGLLDKGLTDKSFLMNGSDHYVLCPSTTHVIDAEEEFTLSVWIQPMQQQQKEQDIAGKFESAHLPSNRDFGIYLDSNRIPAAFVTTTNQSYPLEARANTPASQGEWSHLVMTWNRRGVRLFVNGKPVTDEPPTSEPLRSLRTTHDFTIAGMHRPRNRGNSHRFAGAIDEVRLFARTLKPVEVMYLYLQDAH